MKNKLSLLLGLSTLVFVALACNMSTANMPSLTTSTDDGGKSTTSSFKGGDTLHAQAPIANNPGTVKVKFVLKADDVKGLAKGEALKGSDVAVDIKGDGVAKYKVPVGPGMPEGKYTLEADMINEAGEKKDGKTTSITVTGTAAAPDTKKPAASDEDDS